MEMINKVMAELERLNLSPIKKGKGIIFTFQSVKYMYYDYGMEDYLVFRTHIADVQERSLIDILKAINEVNTVIRFGKLMFRDGNVVASYEYMMAPDAKMEYVIFNAFSTLSYARDKFYSEINSAGIKIK